MSFSTRAIGKASVVQDELAAFAARQAAADAASETNTPAVAEGHQRAITAGRAAVDAFVTAEGEHNTFHVDLSGHAYEGHNEVSVQIRTPAP